ncbi:MAG: FAD-dependent oxidoreductase [Candidatus Limnocylindrales bacterium]
MCVVGGGSAGSTAAIAAARARARASLLVDRLPFLGGTSTAVLDTFYGFYTPGSQRAQGGRRDRRRRRGRRCADSGPCVERPNTYGAGTGVTYLAEHLKVVWERLVEEAGAARPAARHAPGGGGPPTAASEAIVLATRAGLARVRGDGRSSMPPATPI